jgi:hypothetical protein
MKPVTAHNPQPHQTYLSHNITVARAYGIKASLDIAIKRLTARRKPPKWAIGHLKIMETRIAEIIPELLAIRDNAHDAPAYVRPREIDDAQG